MGSTQEIIHKLKPFMSSMTEDMSMYDRFTYVRDIDLCGERMITLVTGNLLKYFNFTVGEPYPLKGMDDLARIKIEEYKQREQKRLNLTDDSGLLEYDKDSEPLEAKELVQLPADEEENEDLKFVKDDDNEYDFL